MTLIKLIKTKNEDQTILDLKNEALKNNYSFVELHCDQLKPSDFSQDHKNPGTSAGLFILSKKIQSPKTTVVLVGTNRAYPEVVRFISDIVNQMPESNNCYNVIEMESL